MGMSANTPDTYLSAPTRVTWSLLILLGLAAVVWQPYVFTQIIWPVLNASFHFKDGLPPWELPLFALGSYLLFARSRQLRQQSESFAHTRKSWQQALAGKGFLVMDQLPEIRTTMDRVDASTRACLAWKQLNGALELLTRNADPTRSEQLLSAEQNRPAVQTFPLQVTLYALPCLALFRGLLAMALHPEQSQVLSYGLQSLLFAMLLLLPLGLCARWLSNSERTLHSEIATFVRIQVLGSVREETSVSLLPVLEHHNEALLASLRTLHKEQQQQQSQGEEHHQRMVATLSAQTQSLLQQLTNGSASQVSLVADLRNDLLTMDKHLTQATVAMDGHLTEASHAVSRQVAQGSQAVTEQVAKGTQALTAQLVANNDQWLDQVRALQTDIREVDPREILAGIFESFRNEARLSREDMGKLLARLYDNLLTHAERMRQTADLLATYVEQGGVADVAILHKTCTDLSGSVGELRTGLESIGDTLVGYNKAAKTLTYLPELTAELKRGGQVLERSGNKMDQTTDHVNKVMTAMQEIVEKLGQSMTEINETNAAVGQSLDKMSLEISNLSHIVPSVNVALAGIGNTLSGLEQINRNIAMKIGH